MPSSLVRLDRRGRHEPSPQHPRRARSFDARPHAASACPSSRATRRRDPRKNKKASRGPPCLFICATPSRRISGPLDTVCMTNGITRCPVRSMLRVSRRRPTLGAPDPRRSSARHDHVEGALRLDVEPTPASEGGTVWSVRPPFHPWPYGAAAKSGHFICSRGRTDHVLPTRMRREPNLTMPRNRSSVLAPIRSPEIATRRGCLRFEPLDGSSMLSLAMSMARRHVYAGMDGPRPCAHPAGWPRGDRPARLCQPR
jgi:hypothetical protein